jgi:serine/threonine protein kinase
MTVPPSTLARYCLVDRYDLQQPLPGALTEVPGDALTLVAYDRRRQMPVTLKLLLNQDPFPWDQLDRLEREAEILDVLDHPGLPQPLGRFEFEAVTEGRMPHPGGFAFVWQVQTGRSLDVLLRSGYTFSEAEVRQIAKQALGILGYLHNRRPPVIHRDICPRNLRLVNDPEGVRLQLVNFGDAQTLVTGEDRFSSRQAPPTPGTAGYMAPELGLGAANPGSELYSLGATLIQLVSGWHPSEGDLSEPLESGGMRSQNADRLGSLCSPAFGAWLMALVQADPLERPRSVTEAIEVGQRLRDQERRDRQSLLRAQSRSRLGRQLIDRVERVERRFLVTDSRSGRATSAFPERLHQRPELDAPLGEPLQLQPRQPRVRPSRSRPALNLLPARSREFLADPEFDDETGYGDGDYRSLDYEVDYGADYESRGQRRTLELDDRTPFPRPNYSGIDLQRSRDQLTILLPSSQIQVLPGQQRRRRSPRMQTFVDQTVGRWFCQARLVIDPMDIALERWCLGVRYAPPIGTSHQGGGDLSIRRGPVYAQLWLQLGRWRCVITGTPSEIEWVGTAIADQLQLPIQR